MLLIFMSKSGIRKFDWTENGKTVIKDVKAKILNNMQGAGESLFHKFFALLRLDLPPGHQGGDQAVLVLSHALLAHLFQHGISGGFLPPQLLLAKGDQLGRRNRFAVPDHLHKAEIAFTKPFVFHPFTPRSIVIDFLSGFSL